MLETFVLVSMIYTTLRSLFDSSVFALSMVRRVVDPEEFDELRETVARLQGEVDRLNGLVATLVALAPRPSTAPIRPSTAPVLAVAAEPAPEPVARVRGARYFVVIIPGARTASVALCPGVYNNKHLYAQAVQKEASLYRGAAIDFCPRSVSRGFPNLTEAKDYWEENFPGAPLHRHW